MCDDPAYIYIYPGTPQALKYSSCRQHSDETSSRGTVDEPLLPAGELPTVFLRSPVSTRESVSTKSVLLLAMSQNKKSVHDILLVTTAYQTSFSVTETVEILIT